MVTCPWCGTSYAKFQPNCSNCGGSLPPIADTAEGLVVGSLQAPPAAPRSLPRYYILRILFTDSAGIVGFILGFIGTIFFIVGAALIIGVVTAFIGLIFAALGGLFLLGGGILLTLRLQNAQQTVSVLRGGEAVLGEITDVYENIHVQVNGRFPWTILYRFKLDGREYANKVTTLSRPGWQQQPGKTVYVLYMPDQPEVNTIYPNPYGYLEV